MLEATRLWSVVLALGDKTCALRLSVVQPLPSILCGVLQLLLCGVYSFWDHGGHLASSIILCYLIIFLRISSQRVAIICNYTMSSTTSNPSNNDDESLKPARRKLKSCNTDLKITVGGDVEGSDAVDYWHNASVMATHSKYVDTMLASGMKESNTYEVSFPDIAPATWESMMKFLEKPLAGRLMTVTDVMEVAAWYDKYDFPEGREISDHILTEYIQAMEAHVPKELDFFINVILLADSAHLDKAQKVGVRWINEAMLHCNQNIFSMDHIARLAPLIAKEESLLKTVKLFIKSGVTKVDILQPLFPELLVEKFASYHKVMTLLDLARGVTLSDFGCNADGDYTGRFQQKHRMINIILSGSGRKSDGEYVGRFWNNRPNALEFGATSYRTGTLGGQILAFKIVVRDDIWVVVGYPPHDENDEEDDEEDDEKILWKCPHSRTLMIPPRDGWVPVDAYACGKIPTLVYRTHSEE
jgi:hypothetical protein